MKLPVALIVAGVLALGPTHAANLAGRALVQSNPCYQALKKQMLDMRRGIYNPDATLACTPEAFQSPSRLTPVPTGHSTLDFCFRVLTRDHMALDRGDTSFDLEPISECTDLRPWLALYEIVEKRHKAK